MLNVTGLGATPGEARERAYAAAEQIEFDGKQMRRDIAARAVEGWRRERHRGVHRRSSPAPETEVEHEFDELDVETPRWWAS